MTFPSKSFARQHGYANYGRGEQSGLGRGGTFSPVSIERKIAQVEHMLDSALPKIRDELKEGTDDRFKEQTAVLRNRRPF